MTLEEAEMMAAVFETADGGCKSCAIALCEEANQMDFGFTWKVEHPLNSVYKNTWIVTASRNDTKRDQ